MSSGSLKENPRTGEGAVSESENTGNATGNENTNEKLDKEDENTEEGLKSELSNLEDTTEEEKLNEKKKTDKSGNENTNEKLDKKDEKTEEGLKSEPSNFGDKTEEEKSTEKKKTDKSAEEGSKSEPKDATENGNLAEKGQKEESTEEGLKNEPANSGDTPGEEPGEEKLTGKKKTDKKTENLAEKGKKDESTEESSVDTTTSGSSELDTTQSSVDAGGDSDSTEDESDGKLKQSSKKENMSKRKTSTPINGSKSSPESLTFTPRQQARSKNTTPKQQVPRDFTKDQGKHDCVLLIGDKKLFCTKVDLLLWSPWFKNKINSRRNTSKRIAEIKIVNQSYEDMLEMLLVINPPFKPINDENIHTLLVIGKDFEMQELLNRAEKYLLTLSPSPSNLSLAEHYNLPVLRRKCMNYYKVRTWVEWDEDDDLFDHLDNETKLCLLIERIKFLEKKSIESGKTCCVLELALEDGIELMEQFNQAKKSEKSSKTVKDFIIKGAEELLFKIKDMIPPKTIIENPNDPVSDLDTSGEKSGSQDSDREEKNKTKQRGNFKKECLSTDSRPHPKTKIASLWDRLSREEDDEEIPRNLSQNSNSSQSTNLGLSKSGSSTPSMYEMDETRPKSVKEFKKAVLTNLNRNRGRYFDSSEEENDGLLDSDKKKNDNESEDFVFSDEDKFENGANGTEKPREENLAEQKKALLEKLNSSAENNVENGEEDAEAKKKKKKKKKSSKQSGDEEENEEGEAAKKSKKKKKKKSKEAEDVEGEEDGEESKKKKKKKKSKETEDGEAKEDGEDSGKKKKKKKKKSKEQTEEGEEEGADAEKKKKKKKKSKEKTREGSETIKEEDAEDEPLKNNDVDVERGEAVESRNEEE